MNHLEFAANESFISDAERDWERWVNKAESLLGLPLDGNQALDGVSLDYAHDAFADGVTPAEYVQEVRDGWASKRTADRVDGYDRDDTGESPDW